MFVASFRRALVLSMLALTLTACNLPGFGGRVPEEAVVGKVLYEQYCAACHGIAGEGQPQWQSPAENGIYPAPPHTAAGHTWHHADSVLLEIFANGGTMPNSAMPGFNEQLSEDEMAAILAHIKTFWGEREREFQELVTKQNQ